MGTPLVIVSLKINDLLGQSIQRTEKNSGAVCLEINKKNLQNKVLNFLKNIHKGEALKSDVRTNEHCQKLLSRILISLNKIVYNLFQNCVNTIYCIRGNLYF